MSEKNLKYLKIFTSFIVVVIIVLLGVIAFGFSKYEINEAVRAREITREERVLGNQDAQVTIIAYSDLQCPYCAEFHETLVETIEKYPEDVRLVFKHFPLKRIHPFAQKAAEASECAGDQNKFWEYVEDLFYDHEKMSESYIIETAEKVGLDKTLFQACLNSGKYTEKVTNDYNTGIADGVNSTPTIFINGLKINGKVHLSEIIGIIDSFKK